MATDPASPLPELSSLLLCPQLTAGSPECWHHCYTLRPLFEIIPGRGNAMGEMVTAWFLTIMASLLTESRVRQVISQNNWAKC